MKESYEKNLKEQDKKRQAENQKSREGMEEAVNQLQAELQQIQNQWCTNERQLLAEKQNAEERATLAIQKL